MPEQQIVEPSMEEYVAKRTAEVSPTNAATTPTEQVETAPESAPGTPESEEEKKSKGGGWQRRIDKLTKRSTELEEALKEEREARQRLEARQAGRDPAELAKAKPVEPGTRPEPTVSDTNPDGTLKYSGNDGWDRFHADLRKWDREQVLIEVENKAKQSAEKAEVEKQGKTIQENFEKRAKAYFDAHPADKELLLGEDSPAAQIPAGSVMDAIILESDNSCEILKHLCDNPEEITRILALSPVGQAREMVKIEQAVSSEEQTSPEPKKASLPAPIRPLSTGTSKSTVKPENMDMDEYARGRKAGTIR